MATLRDLHAENATIHAYCSNWRGGCTHTGIVPIENLIQHLGWDFPYIERRNQLLEALVCSKCGHNRPEIQHHRMESFNSGQGGHSLSSSGAATPEGVRSSKMAEYLERWRRFRAEHPEPPMKYGGKNRRKFR